MLYCPTCGAKTQPDARFCVACGTPLTAAPTAPQPQSAPPAPQPEREPATPATDLPPTVASNPVVAPAATHRTGRSRRVMVIAVVGAFLLATGGWAIAHRFLTPGPLTAPETLDGGWTTQTAWAKDWVDPQALVSDTLRQPGRDGDAAALSAAFDGAEAVVQDYQRDDVGELLRVRAVRAQAPIYWVHHNDTLTEFIGVGLPLREVVAVGPVACLVVHTATAPGTEETTENTSSECMRTSADLTVWTSMQAQLPATVAALAQSAWEALGGEDVAVPEWPKGEGFDVPVNAPATFDGGAFIPRASTGPENGSERYAEADAADTLVLSEVYAGATAYSASYVDAPLEKAFTVSVVRAESPVPYVMYVDLERMNLLAPTLELRAIGDVTCVLLNCSLESDGDPADLHSQVVSCMRSGPELTVWVDQVSPSMAEDLTAVVGLVDQAWTDASLDG